MKLARTLLSLSVIAAFLCAIPARHLRIVPRYERATLVAPFQPPMERWCMLPFPLLARTRSRQRIVAPNTNELQPAWASFATVAFLCCLMICDRDGWTSLRLLMMLEWVTPITVLTVMIVFLILWQDGPEIDCDTDAGRRDSFTSDDSS